MKDPYNNLRPGKSSDDGFLNQTESLDDVTSADEKTLSELGLTYYQFADRLLTLMEKARRKSSLWMRKNPKGSVWDIIKNGIIIEGRYRVSWDSYMGYQDCPFGCEGREALSDTDFTIENGHESVFFSELHPHLIREHHFFEGHTRYRLDPEICARVLDIESGKDYAPNYTSKEYWVSHGSSFSSCNKTIKDYIDSEFRKESKDIVKCGTKIDISGERAAWQKDDSLYIVSLDQDEYEEIEIDGTPVLNLDTGSSTFKRQIVKWVDDG